MDINETATILAGLKTKLGPGTQVEFAPGVQISRNLPSPFDMLLKERPGPSWTEMQIGDEFKRAVDLAKNSDIAVMVLGENQDMSGEYASRSTIDLPGRQLELLQAVTATGKPVVLVLLKPFASNSVRMSCVTGTHQQRIGCEKRKISTLGLAMIHLRLYIQRLELLNS